MTERNCKGCGRRFASKGRLYCSLLCREESKPRRDAERFWRKVQKGDGCWQWLAFTSGDGYGYFGVGLRLITAHRFSWQLANGEIPDGLCVLHSCDNPPCVNPAHLFLGTQLDNVADMMRKGRQAIGSRVASAKLTDADIIAIRQRRAMGEGIVPLGAEFRVGNAAISQIANGKVWKHVQ